MPNMKVSDIQIYYEAFGKGKTIFWLQSPWGRINPGAYYISGRMSRHFRIIIWDGINTKPNNFKIENSPSEYHLNCKYIKELCDNIGEQKVYFAGGSGGGELALLMAYLYPELVEGVIMYRPTDTTSEIEKEILRSRYFNLSNIAKNGSIKTLIDYSNNPPESRWSSITKWLSKIADNENNIKKLESFGMDNLSVLLDLWGKWMGNEGFFKANLKDDELSQISIPVLIYPAPDEHHPYKIAKELYAKLPNAKIVEGIAFREESEMYNGKDEEHRFGEFVNFVDSFEVYLLDL